MSIENGKCPSCGGALLLDSSKEKTVCKYCGHEVVIPQAVQKCVIDGIADFDTLMLTAQGALDFDGDFDKARENYLQALKLRPQDYRALWGMYLCDIAGILWARQGRGYVQYPGDIPDNVAAVTNRYGNKAYTFAPDDVKPYYYREMQMNSKNITNPVEEPEQKKGCYVATAVYGSYDCPEVWVLRRYRDFSLDKSFFGRFFIRMYYAISPTVVKVFGKTKWFNRFWKKRLDKKVLELKAKGYADTPYNDCKGGNTL